MSSRRLDVAVIGCGDIAVSQHLPALMRDERFEVTVVADLVRERAERAAARFGVPSYTEDVAAALALEPHVVVIATPPHISQRLAAEALGAGAHVLCEKPMAVSLDAADRLVALAEGSGCVFQVGFKNRFAPWSRDSGSLSSKAAWGNRCSSGSARSTRRIVLPTGCTPTESGASSKRAVLSCTMVRTRQISSIGCSGHRSPSVRRRFKAIRRSRRRTITTQRSRTRMGRSRNSRWAGGFHIIPGELQVFGPAGTAELSRPLGYLRFHDGHESVEQRCEEDWQTVCFREQLDAFYRAIADELQTGADARAGRDALALTIAIIEAAEGRRSVQYKVPA